MKSIKTLSDLRGKSVLLRTDFNVPIEKGKVADPYRLDTSLKTLHFLLAHGARVVIASHTSASLGSLLPVYEYLRTKLPISFTDDVIGSAAKAEVQKLTDGRALLLQNLRRNSGEEKNDPEFARALASFADIYVNDAFPVSHRSHASIVGVPKLLPSFAGFQFLAEIEGLTGALYPQSPSLAIVGGAKLVTKIALLRSLLSKYDHVFVGGALANDFYAAKGYEVGKSLISGTDTTEGLLTNSKILLPDRVTASTSVGREEKLATDVEPEETISDIPPSGVEQLVPLIAKARVVLWNGPMGHFEVGFTEGTDAIARMVSEAGGKTIVGGGDTLASIQNLGLMEKFTFVSTAGGAMLDFLAHGTLPGIDALDSTV